MTQIRLLGGCHTCVADSALGRKGMKHMADEAEGFVARVERPLGQVFESPEVDQGKDGDYPFGDGGATAYVHGGQSVLAEPRAR